jgi:hypothetical protein
MADERCRVIDFPLTGKASKAPNTFSSTLSSEPAEKSGKTTHGAPVEIVDFPGVEKGKACLPTAANDATIFDEARPLIDPERRIAGNSDGKSDGKLSTLSTNTPIPPASTNGKLSKLSTSITREEALADLRKVMALSGDVPSQRTLSIRWGVREGTVSKWCGRWERAGKISRRKSGKCREVQPMQFASLHEAGSA